MADVTFGIRAVDNTRGAFLSVGQGFRQLDQQAKDFKRSIGFLGGAIAGALGFGVSQIADKTIKKARDVITGMDDEDRAAVERTVDKRKELKELESNLAKAKRTDQEQLNFLVAEEEKLRRSIAAGFESGSISRITEAQVDEQIQLNDLLLEQEQIRKRMAPNMEQLSKDLREMESKAGQAFTSSLEGNMMSLRERQDFLEGVKSSLQSEQQQIGDKDLNAEQMRRKIENYKEQIQVFGQIKEAAEAAKQPAKELGAVFAGSFEDAVFSGAKLRVMLKNITMDLARAAFRQLITTPLAGVASSFLGNIFRAEGGPVSAGQPYIVGEQGPELMVPGSSGSIIPNHRLTRGGSGPTIIIHQSNSYASGVQAADLARFAQFQKEDILAEAQRRLATRRM